MNSGRVVAGLLIGAGVVVLVAGIGLIGVMAATGFVNPAGLAVGIFFMIIVSLPLIGLGIVLFTRAAQEGKDEEVQKKQRKILDMVATRGELRISDAALELKASREQIQSWVYNLVGLGVFSGYVNWDDGVLYSAQASQLKGMETCKKCGGKLSLAGKGVIKCPYCGTEYFI
jgi:hypothetical protein